MKLPGLDKSITNLWGALNLINNTSLSYKVLSSTTQLYVFRPSFALFPF